MKVGHVSKHNICLTQSRQLFPEILYLALEDSACIGYPSKPREFRHQPSCKPADDESLSKRACPCAVSELPFRLVHRLAERFPRQAG